MTVDLLVIPDGAAEEPGASATSLERARTPALDELCARGTVRAVETTPPGLPPGSETGIPTLLGARLSRPVGRGAVEAAAAGIDVPRGTVAWRCDVRRGDAAAAARISATPGIRHLRGHRFLLVAREPPRMHGVHVWQDGASLPRMLDAGTVVVSGPGAAAGCARLLGARSVVPPGTTGDTTTNLDAKLRAARAAVAAGARRVVVHVGAPDEAAHAGDAEAKVSSLEAIDAIVVAPLLRLVERVGGRLSVCPDHCTDPTSGRHGAGPVPCVSFGAGVHRRGPDRLSERELAA